MVARIKKTHSLSRAVNYNEKKVNKGIAKCILSVNYAKDLERLGFSDKLNRLTNLASLNKNVVANCLHINLNFDPSEKLSGEQLCEIASVYMERIGFGNQPYLVYRHEDAGHPHIHIVTTNIQPDGKRIETNNIGRNQSENARKEIELKFGLVQATGTNIKAANQIKPVNAQRVQYGKSETKRAITNVLDSVFNSYKYTSLAELNAVLKSFNVVADRGKEDSSIYKNRGLNYRILDKKGNKIGVPIKASSIYSKPTLVNIEKKFALNELKRKPDLKRIKAAIDWVIAKKPESFQALARALEKEQIYTAVRQNAQGFIYGLTFVDHKSKSVFNGSDIGKPYSAKAILEKCGQSPQTKQPTYHSEPQQASRENILESANSGSATADVIEILFAQEHQNNSVPYGLKKKRKKKKQTQQL